MSDDKHMIHEIKCCICLKHDPEKHIVTVWQHTECATKLKARVEKLEGENYQLRKLLWLRHGCDIKYLYGDDGELQCNHPTCMIDFKRMSFYEIEKKFIIKGGAMTREQLEVLEKINES